MAEVSLMGQRIRAYRQRAQLNQTELAEKTGIPRSMIAAVENGHRQGLSVGNLIRIADAMGLSVDQLVRASPGEASVSAKH